MKERVEIEIAGGIADVKLIRADKMNALDDRMFDALIEAGTQLSADASIRCVVLSGTGRAFCAGIDLGRLGATSGADGAADAIN